MVKLVSHFAIHFLLVVLCSKLKRMVLMWLHFLEDNLASRKHILKLAKNCLEMFCFFFVDLKWRKVVEFTCVLDEKNCSNLRRFCFSFLLPMACLCYLLEIYWMMISREIVKLWMTGMLLAIYLQKWEEQVKIYTTAMFLHNIKGVKTFISLNIKYFGLKMFSPFRCCVEMLLLYEF